jgi:hypothetical protein
LQKRYISMYASLLKSDLSRAVVDDNKEIEELDRGLDIELILQWRYIFWPQMYQCYLMMLVYMCKDSFYMRLKV